MSIDEKEFQLDVLKIQMMRQEISTAYYTVLPITISMFVSIGAAFLSYGLTSDNNWYSLLGAICIGILFPINYLLGRYFTGERIKKITMSEINNEIKFLYNKYIVKKGDVVEKDENLIKLNSIEFELKRLYYSISLSENKIKGIMKKINDLQGEQLRLSSIKVSIERDYCICGNVMPNEIKISLEKTGVCPICQKKIESNISTQKDAIQKQINKKHRKITAERNKITKFRNE